MSDGGSGWPELDDALARWQSATTALPSAFRAELLATLDAVEDATLTLEWRAAEAERRGFLARFPHPFARVYDHTMLYLSLSLGLSGPRVRMIPIGGLILRRHFGALEAQDPPSAVPDDQPELTQLRSLLAYVTSADVPGREANGESC